MAIRTKIVNFSEITPEQRYDILRGYIEGEGSTDTMKKLATKYSLAVKTVSLFLNRFYKEFTTTKELQSLLSSTSNPRFRDTYKPPSYVAEDMLAKIEKEGADIIYANVYYETKSNEQALKEAGLVKDIKDATSVNKGANRLKGIYLRSLDTVKGELDRLRTRELKEANLSPEMIQIELLSQLRQLNSYDNLEYRDRQLILRTIELLGKTKGAFIDKLTVETLDPNKALDQLISMNRVPVASSTYHIDDQEDYYNDDA